MNEFPIFDDEVSEQCSKKYPLKTIKMQSKFDTFDMYFYCWEWKPCIYETSTEATDGLIYWSGEMNENIKYLFQA